MDLQALKARLPLFGVIVGASAVIFPITMDHSPSEVAQSVKSWAPLFYAVGGLLLLYAYTVLVYRKGRASVNVAPAPPPAQAGCAALPLGELIYTANEVATIVTERGNMRLQAYEALLPRLERSHPAWHDEMIHADRNLFLAAVRRVRDLRVINGPGWRAGPYAAGDLTEAERDEVVGIVEGMRAGLVTGLKRLEGA